jgi:hypothetical protein
MMDPQTISQEIESLKLSIKRLHEEAWSQYHHDQHKAIDSRATGKNQGL